MYLTKHSYRKIRVLYMISSYRLGDLVLLNLPINDVNAQERLSVNQLKDLNDNASKMLNTLTDYISIIAAAEESYDTRHKGIELCIKLFTQNALIEEQNKATKTKKSY